jgi:hypothetical protein
MVGHRRYFGDSTSAPIRKPLKRFKKQWPDTCF